MDTSIVHILPCFLLLVRKSGCEEAQSMTGTLAVDLKSDLTCMEIALYTLVGGYTDARPCADSLITSRGPKPILESASP